MSLRLRLIIVIGLVLLLSLSAGGVIAWRHSVRSVQTEMDAAVEVGAQNVRSALDDIAGSGAKAASLAELVKSFNGDRHLRATVIASDGSTVIATSTLSLEHRVPDWFVAGLATGTGTLRIALPPQSDGSAIVLEADPRNEIGEVWTEFRDAASILAVFCVLSFATIYWVVGRILRPLRALADAFRAIGDGDYRPRLAVAGPPEIAHLDNAFNLMAERLGVLEARNEKLTAQLLTLEEEERADLARDLHDEIGPFLFAINVDAATIPGLPGGTTSAIRERAASIQESITHVQKHVRAILGRLRPAALSEVGLSQAMHNLALFWQHKNPGVAITIAVPEDADEFGERVEAAVYRIVQESLSNAVRHGRPHAIDISVEIDDGGEILVTISDDGMGLGQSPGGHSPGNIGYGLTGMRERVAALGGTLTVANRPGGGTAVTARLPFEPIPVERMPVAT